MYSALAVANAFIDRALNGKIEDLTPMKLQKLLFFTQSWHLKINGEPLFDDFFARWRYGPVIPSIYHEFKQYGPNEITDYGKGVVNDDEDDFGIRLVIPEIDWKCDRETVDLVDKIIEVYGEFTGWELSVMTHEEGSAWKISGGADGGPIPFDTMAKHIHPEQ
jgi:uncharacterized phage-associated protein